MFKILTSTDGGNTYYPASGFTVKANTVEFFTPQNQTLKFHHSSESILGLLGWCEARLNNANNNKNKVKIIQNGNY